MPSHLDVYAENLCVGGINIQLYRSEVQSAKPVAIVYLLHGRLRSKEKVREFARKLVLKGAGYEEGMRSLWVVTFDHRNHGSRLVSDLANRGWNEEGRHNPQHAVDMYSIQLGSARDISFLTDFLPSYLFPNGENAVVEWGVVGISLGGHSAWLSMRHDARIRVGVPIIGCPDFLGLMTYRAGQSGMGTLEAPHLPASLRELVKSQDPVSFAGQNSFLGKSVLVLSGADDTLVPWSVGAEFVERLDVGNGLKRSKEYKGVGHKCTEEMEDEAFSFLRDTLLS